MAIDNCKYPFEDLAQAHFPKFFAALDAKRHEQVPASTFTDYGYKGTLRELGLQKDFQGCYVFFEQNTPLYVGISQKAIRRVQNHFNAANHHRSSLVYKIARERNIIHLHRKDYKGQAYQDEFANALKRVQSWSVTFLEIPCHVSLYLFEVYVAMRYDTKYNSFETH